MRHKLLLADDSVTIQRVIELTFADEDVQVIAVGDGKKAIEAVQASRPDIVLADVGMPERDGYEVAAFIKGNPELAHIPVLLLTGAFEPIDETRARAVGCDGVLVKPFEPQMVINRVKDLLAGRRPAGLWSASPAAQTPSRPSAQSGNDFDMRAPAPAVPVAAAAGTGAGAGGSLEDYFDRLDAAFASLDGGTAGASPTAVSPPPASPSPGFDPQAHHAAATAATAASSPSGDDVLGGWDPDLTGDPRKPAAIEPPPIELDPSRGFAPAAAPSPPASATQAAPSPQVSWTHGPSPPASATQAGASAAQAAASAAPSPSAYTASAAEALSGQAASTGQVPSAPQPPPAYAPPGTGAATVPLAPAARLPSLAEAFAALLSAEQSQPVAPSAMVSPPVSDDMVEEIVRRVTARMGDQAVRDTVVDVAERLVRQEIERIRNA